ncbi:MAG: hypothetical protein RLZZ604_630 [Pseudomonadota bacterium]
MNEQLAREEICRIGKSLFDRSYVHATAGNISVRIEDGFLITPTDACLGFLDPDRLAKIDIHGQQLSGDKASKTMALHAAIYNKARQFDQDTSCIIHTHSTHCVALTLESNPFTGDGVLPELLPTVAVADHVAGDIDPQRADRVWTDILPDARAWANLPDDHALPPVPVYGRAPDAKPAAVRA